MERVKGREGGEGREGAEGERREGGSLITFSHVIVSYNYRSIILLATLPTRYIYTINKLRMVVTLWWVTTTNCVIENSVNLMTINFL